MEKTKKSISLVALVLALVLLAGVVGYVVYAAVNQSFNFGGKVTFEADGVNATVTAGETTNCTITNDSEDALQTIIYSTKVDEADTSGEDSWDNLTVTLSNSPATFSFTVKNTSTTDSLYVTIGTITYTNTYSNNEITVKTNIDEGEETEVDPSGSLEIIVTFTVANTNYDAELTSFTLPVTLSNEAAEVPSYTVTVTAGAYAINGATEWTYLSGTTTLYDVTSICVCDGVFSYTNYSSLSLWSGTAGTVEYNEIPEPLDDTHYAYVNVSFNNDEIINYTSSKQYSYIDYAYVWFEITEDSTVSISAGYVLA